MTNHHRFRRLPLHDQDYAAIQSVRWRRWDAEIVCAVAEGWQAGLSTTTLALCLNCQAGSLRCLVGKLRQIGVRLRPAKAQFHTPRRRSPQADRIARAQLRRIAAQAQISGPRAVKALAPMLKGLDPCGATT